MLTICGDPSSVRCVNLLLMRLPLPRFTRFILISIGTSIGLFISFHWFVSDTIEEELTKRGITYQSKKRSLLGLNYYQLTWNQNIASRLHVPFLYPPTITVYDGKGIISQSKNTRTSKEQYPIVVHVQNLDLYYPKMNLEAEDFNGTIYPTIDISSPNLSITRSNGKTNITGTVPHPLEGDDVSLTITKDGDETEFSASISSFSLKHPLLSQTTIHIPKSELKGNLNGSRLNASLSMIDSNISWYGTIDLRTYASDISYDGSISLSTLHRIFPLSQPLSLSGSFLVNGTFQWPQKDWSLSLDSNDLTVSGELFDPLPFKHGTFSHTSPSTGKLHVSGPQTKYWTPYSKLGWMAKTAIASEDIAFWNHKGFSTKSMEEAIQDYRRKKTIRGGSTITQQLAKNLFLSSEKTFERKVHELIYTIALEHFLTKEEILTIYLNVVEFGPEIHGIDKASQLYFLKKPSSLTLVESAYLASILPAPTRFFTIAQQSKRIPRGRTDRVLKNLLDSRIISKAEFDLARRTPLLVLPPTE
ncbi:MAG: hypothetical protein CL916_01935 [Deltaproteobacteria bacterium]|nr:hypothetical protein [Deltaproteobacteria bacterium]